VGATSIRELVSGRWRAVQDSRETHRHTAFATTGVCTAAAAAVLS
jgi:hypothetical protein